MRATSVNSIPEPTYGGQLQNLSIQGHKAEGQIKIEYKEKPVKLAGGETVHLSAPTYSIVDLGYGPLAEGTMISPRVAPPMIGLGLLEAIPEKRNPRQCRPRRRQQGRHLRQAELGLVEGSRTR